VGQVRRLGARFGVCTVEQGRGVELSQGEQAYRKDHQGDQGLQESEASLAPRLLGETFHGH
jgi:hypothetical protein